MSQKLIPGHITRFPFIQISSVAGVNLVLNATGETLVMAGYIILENPEGGNKTISAAGGGSIRWRTASITNVHANTVFKVGIQDISTGSSPVQGDGVFDVSTTYTGVAALTANTSYTSVMDAGTKTISHGQLIGIVFEMTTLGGADSIAVRYSNRNLIEQSNHIPCCSDNTSGSYVYLANSAPLAYIIFDDGSVGWFFGCPYIPTQGTNVTVSSESATADEYGNYLNYPAVITALGATICISSTTSSSDFELILYSDPLGTPVAERTVVVDASTLGAYNTARSCTVLFSSPFRMKANTPYVVACRPLGTGANTVVILYNANEDSTDGKTNPGGNSNSYSVRRLDNTGAFSDYNGGTSQTRCMLMSIVGAYEEQGIGISTSHLGM